MQQGAVFSAALLALTCLACAVAVGRARTGYGEGDQPALFCALLGFLLPAAAAATTAPGQGLGPDWQAAQLWLSQASDYLALPLLGAAALTLARGWVWSRPNWGRLLLGLCAFFELFRQLHLLDDYRLLLSLATLLLLLYVGAVQWPRRQPLLAALGASGLLLLAEQLAGSASALGPLGPVDLQHLLQVPAYGLLAWLLLTLPGSPARTEKPVKTL
ncbi:hypothetical protein [Pseudomonas benzenivorans]|uniref:Uncharacterized protein n=1 Tax=Pseudomonas benzenivorans TaxID=556533 RepID=A0ABY5H2Q8_9PSED|nr:hypothetical protein [Pseudomonas benzenivorans]UTW06586.1 hypothetical protein KDW96_15585 [Pseudomonas benzenivorans]